MANTWLDDDDQLLAALSRALRIAPEVPPLVLEAARSAFTWRDIDGELATLAYDSLLDQDLVTAVRAPAAMRFLTFESEAVTLQLGVSDDGLQGQLVPSQGWVVEVKTPGGTGESVAADHLGRFTVGPLPSGPVRLRCRSDEEGASITTEWVTV